MSRWIKVVALFLLTFALLDVCTAEPCDVQILPENGSKQFELESPVPGADHCQFEEDCFGCAHFVPRTLFTFLPIEVVTSAPRDLAVYMLPGTHTTLYHPPRA